jgi:hypothetical protein
VALEWTRDGCQLEWNNKGCASVTVSRDNPFDPGTRKRLRDIWASTCSHSASPAGDGLIEVLQDRWVRPQSGVSSLR